MTTRRRFLHLAAAAPALTIFGRAWAASSSSSASSPRFLLVFLRGGYDCANAIIPYSSALYYESRKSIAIAKPDAKNPTGALALDDAFALAPALRPTLAPLWEQKQIAFIPFAGTDDVSRSHFETQDHIELGQANGVARDFRSGFLARLAKVLGNEAKPIAFTDALPISFAGGDDVPNVALKAVAKAPFDARQSEILASMYRGTKLEAAVVDGLELRQRVASELIDEMKEANRGAVTPKGFEAEARRIARLMRDRYRIGFVDVGGWDTHVNQGGEKGALATNLENLGKGLAAFSQELGTEWKNTVVVVVSEFGRTFRENGDKGTDHGHGSVYWVLGGSVAGGRIVGERVAVDRKSLFQDRDYPVLTDVRDLLSGLFAKLWSPSSSDLDRVFPGATPRDLKLV
jgi:uncharacterized protein (DUF1501 family)